MKKNWKSTLLGILVLVAQLFVDSQRSKVDEQSLVSYSAGAGLIVAADSKKEKEGE